MTLQNIMNKMMGIWHEPEKDACMHYVEIQRKIHGKQKVSIDDLKCYNKCRYGLPKQGCVGYLTQEHLDKFNEVFEVVE